MKIRDFGNRLIATLGGRSIHPLRTKIGGFTTLPTQAEIIKLLQEIPSVIDRVQSLVEVYRKVKFPEFNRPTEFYALTNSHKYAFYQGGYISANPFSKIS